MGTCTFFETKIKKMDFTTLCTNPDFVLDDDTLKTAAAAMKLTGEELDELLQAAAAKRQEIENRE